MRSTPELRTRWVAIDERPRTEVFDEGEDLHDKEGDQAGDRCSARLRRLGFADCLVEQLHEPVLARSTVKVESGKQYRYVQLFLDCAGKV